MIQMRVSAVFQVRDGFLGRAVEGGRLRCTLDGAPVHPVGKPGGYLILVNLADGAHRLAVQCPEFQEELIDFHTDAGAIWESYVALKPAEGYFFRQTVTRLHLTVLEGKTPAAGQVVWLTSPGTTECKIAQSKAAAGENEVRLYCKGSPAVLPIPGPFFLEDGADSETVILQELAGETGRLAAPLRKSHSRSRLLMPVQAYRAGQDGRIRAVFHTPGTVLAFREDRGEVKRLELMEGENEGTLSW